MNPFVRVMAGVMSRAGKVSTGRCRVTLLSDIDITLGDGEGWLQEVAGSPAPQAAGDYCWSGVPVCEVGEVGGEGAVAEILCGHSYEGSGEAEHVAVVVGELQCVEGRSYRLQRAARGGP